MYIKLKDNSGEIYYVPPNNIAYLKQSRPTGASATVYKVVLNCGKQIILTEPDFFELRCSTE